MARPREFDPAAVRDQALRRFWRDGYDGTSLSDLEQATGLGRRSLYNSFGDKMALFLGALTDFRALAADTVLSGLEAPGAGLAAIEHTLMALAAAGQTPQGRNGCLICSTAAEPVARQAEVGQQVWLHFDRAERAFLKALTQARADGALRTGDSVESLAKFLLGTLVSLCTLARAGAPAPTLDAVAAEALNRLR